MCRTPDTEVCAELQIQERVRLWDFPGSPVVKILPSNAGGAGSTLSQGAKIPHASWPKKQNIKQKQYCNKFKKTLKMVHVKKVLKKKKEGETCGFNIAGRKEDGSWGHEWRCKRNWGTEPLYGKIRSVFRKTTCPMSMKDELFFFFGWECSGGGKQDEKSS